jgi:hypothetical protein
MSAAAAPKAHGAAHPRLVALVEGGQIRFPVGVRLRDKAGGGGGLEVAMPRRGGLELQPGVAVADAEGSALARETGAAFPVIRMPLLSCHTHSSHY